MSLSLGTLKLNRRLIGAATSTGQQVVLASAVLAYVSRHRQLDERALEAGGQLFGEVTKKKVTIRTATGPHLGDERSRFSYRSSPRLAQAQIAKHFREGLLYLGEWHTHPEPMPQASGADLDAVSRLMQKSRLNTSALLLLLVGQKQDSSGLTLLKLDSSGVTQLHWT